MININADKKRQAENLKGEIKRLRGLKMVNKCLYCSNTGYIPDRTGYDQMCPYCEIGQAVIKSYNKARDIGIQAYDTLLVENTKNKRLKAMYEAAKDDLEDMMKSQEYDLSTITELLTENAKLQQTMRLHAGGGVIVRGNAERTWTYQEYVIEYEQLLAENERLKQTIRLHSGDGCSLANEIELFKSHWQDAEDENKELRAENKQLKDGLILIRKSTEIMEARRFAERALATLVVPPRETQRK